MPIRTSDISSGNFSFSVSSSRPAGDYNVCVECWLSPDVDNSNGYNGGAELMIVLDLHNMGYSGSQMGTYNGYPGNDAAAEEFSETINLNAGQLYDIRMEYYKNGGDAVAQLLWSCNYQSKEIIPQSRLYSESIQPTPELPTNLCDVNGDSSINIVDALIIAQYYVGLITGFCLYEKYIKTKAIISL